MMKVLAAQQLPMPVLANSFFPFNPSLDDEMKRLFTNFTVGPVAFTRPNPEDVMEEFRRNGRDYEYCPELETGVIPVPNPRRKKNKKPLPSECAFCKNNGEEPSYYRRHLLKDGEGRVACPVLRAYTCPICGSSGDTAHTIKYCPANKNPEIISTANAIKNMRNSSGKRRSK